MTVTAEQQKNYNFNSLQVNYKRFFQNLGGYEKHKFQFLIGKL